MPIFRKKTRFNLLECGLGVEILEKLQRVQISDRGLMLLQESLDIMGREILNLKEENLRLKSAIEIKEEAIEKQRRNIIRMNEEAGRSDRMSRDEKIWRLRAQGLSVRNIAEIMGLSKTRVGEILKGVRGADTLDQEWFVHGVKNGVVSRLERDQEICQRWESGISQKELALAFGLSTGRVSQIILKYCTLGKKAFAEKENISNKAKKNNFHRNTQRKIELIRQLNPRLAEKCESREMKVMEAYKKVEPDIYRLGLKEMPGKPA